MKLWQGVLWLLVASLCFAELSLASGLMVEGTCKNGARAVLTFEASQLQVLSPVKANLKLIDKDDQPINSALVYCSLYIPNVATGANNPKLVQSEEGGIYNGVVFFGDAGKWKAALTINFPGGGYEELVLDIGQVMPKKS